MTRQYFDLEATFLTHPRVKRRSFTNANGIRSFQRKILQPNSRQDRIIRLRFVQLWIMRVRGLMPEDREPSRDQFVD